MLISHQLVVRVTLFIILSVAAFAQPTWSGTIAQIVYSKCTPCHRAGEIAPFPLTSYQETVSHALTIRSAVQTGYMPPWKPVKGHAAYLGDRSLSEEQTASLLAWIEADMPEGNPLDAPKPPTFPSGSQLGTPDLVLTMNEEWIVQANSKDEYRYFVLPTNLLQDQNISAIEFRPGNAKVVHHVLYFLDTTGTARMRDSADPLPGYVGFGDPGFTSAASYLGWVPGSQQRMLPATIGAKLLKGSDLVIQVHYAPSPTEETDRSSVNIFFNKSQNIRVMQQFQIDPTHMTPAFYIPANEKKNFVGKFTIPLDVSMIAVAPHMHLLGRNAKAYAVAPKGDTIWLVKINDWDFNWQGSYAFQNLVKVPRNSVLHYEAEYDNTTANPYNPSNPPKLITWGEKTTDEMFLSYFFWLPYQKNDETLSMETTPTSITELLLPDLDMSVAPNPTTGNAHLALSLPAATTLSVSITDALGKTQQNLVRSMPYESGQHTIVLPIEHLSTGTYFVHVQIANTVIAKPIQVVH